ncbi:MAG TPA: helix-turn-helix domain-containing protein [Candidatus Thermoplasmatota archaeon]|nr:helix-turn-helix domain-containing protein [Candidatus Thermoplasmatota archaeon]
MGAHEEPAAAAHRRKRGETVRNAVASAGTDADVARARLLAEAGLTSYECRIYLAAFGRGACAAKDLARLSGVPRTRVYDVLAALASRGLVEERAGPPRAFVALPPESFLAREAREAAALVSVLETRVAQWPAASPSPAVDAPFRLIEGPVAESQAVAEALAKARTSMACDVRAETLSSWLNDASLAPLLRRALALPEVQAVVSGPASATLRLAADEAAPVIAGRPSRRLDVERVVIDGRLLLLRIPRASGGADVLVAEHEVFAREEARVVRAAREAAAPLAAVAAAIRAGARVPIERGDARETVLAAIERATREVIWLGPPPEGEVAQRLLARAALGLRVRVLGPAPLPGPPWPPSAAHREAAEVGAPFVLADGVLAIEPRGDRALVTAVPGRGRILHSLFETLWSRAAPGEGAAPTRAPHRLGGVEDVVAGVRRGLEATPAGGAFAIALATDDVTAFLPDLVAASERRPRLRGRILLARAPRDVALPAGFDVRIAPRQPASYFASAWSGLLWWAGDARARPVGLGAHDPAAVEAALAAFDLAWRRARPLPGRRRA